MKKRYVIVGASFRCYMLFVCTLTERYKDTVALTGVYDVNRTRCEFFKKKVGDEMTVYDDFDRMLDTEKPDGVIVTTSDKFHHEYIIRSLKKGYDVFCEKPVTNTYERCLAIRNAEKETGHKVTVTFNCRFMPYFAEVKRLIMEGKIGRPLHVTYDYFLNSNHGGDYFKRWHRKMENSEGMLLHKSTHHFDIVNWLLEDEPCKVTALGNRVYFGDESKSHAKRCKECTYTECECYSSQTGPCDEEMYYKAEHEDGYIRDKCSFLPDTDIYDNMSVSVQYTKGAILAYSLHLFSTYEGYRMTITGEKGVLETAIGYSKEEEVDPKFTVTITNRKGEVEVIRLDKEGGGHGGGDNRLIDMFFGGETNDPLGQFADGYAGFTSAMIGIGANESIREGKTVTLTERLKTLR